MDKVIDFFHINKIWIIICSILLVTNIVLLISSKNDKKESITVVDVKENEINKPVETNNFFVDVKGAVKNPGVYEVTNEMIINDVLKLAKLKSTATTNNINLSKKLSEGMVVYISTKNELQNETVKYIYLESECTCDKLNITECVVDKSSVIDNTSSNKISLNKATKEELMTLSGIGEAKAIAIIEYREKNLFEKIEDIMNISGIGEKMFAEIKENITT